MIFLFDYGQEVTVNVQHISIGPDDNWDWVTFLSRGTYFPLRKQSVLYHSPVLTHKTIHKGTLQILLMKPGLCGF